MPRTLPDYLGHLPGISLSSFARLNALGCLEGTTFQWLLTDSGIKFASCHVMIAHSISYQERKLAMTSLWQLWLN
jgi:hypothetical protein